MPSNQNFFTAVEQISALISGCAIGALTAILTPLDSILIISLILVALSALLTCLSGENIWKVLLILCAAASAFFITASFIYLSGNITTLTTILLLSAGAFIANKIIQKSFH